MKFLKSHGSKCIHAKKSITRLVLMFLFLVLVSGGIFTHVRATNEATVITREVETTKTVYANHKEHYPEDLPPILHKICTCESGNGTGKPQHFEADGKTVKRGRVTPNDVGACQINTDAEVTDWYDKARDLGLDVYDEQDNYKMALWIFENEGDDHWNSSKSCWK